LPKLLSIDKDARDVKRLLLWCDNAGMGHLLLALCLCALLTGQLTSPMLAQSDQHSITSDQSPAEQGKVGAPKLPAKPQKELPPPQSSAQESKPAQPKTQTSKSEESKAKKDVKEEGAEKDKEGTGKGAVFSLILTVKLALLEDPLLFPYEIEVDGGSDEITLLGKVSTETEKAAAATIASTVPTVKSVSNKLEVVKDLPDIITHKQDEIITRYVKERFAQSATVTAAKFDVKTELGIVSLCGTVRFQVSVWEAAEAARQVPGVKAVRTDKVRIEREG
jgi:hyperosmotically inducible periplasmic protein